MKKSVKVVIMIAMILVSLAIAFICVLKITEKKKGQLTGDPMRAVYLEKDDGEGIFCESGSGISFLRDGTRGCSL